MVRQLGAKLHSKEIGSEMRVVTQSADTTLVGCTILKRSAGASGTVYSLAVYLIPQPHMTLPQRLKNEQLYREFKKGLEKQKSEE